MRQEGDFFFFRLKLCDGSQRKLETGINGRTPLEPFHFILHIPTLILEFQLYPRNFTILVTKFELSEFRPYSRNFTILVTKFELPQFQLTPKISTLISKF